MRQLLLTLFILFCISSAKAGDTDSLSILANKRANRAALFSAVVPGLGQAYNHKYWKLPILYAGFGTLAYFIHTNDVEYKKYRTSMIYRYDNDSTTIDPYSRYSDADITIRRDYYRRNRDLSIIITGVVYVLNIVDAYVDSQLLDFDVSDDLSLHTTPALFTTPGGDATAGLQFTLTFK
ncbi:MAG: DUF5683 domain-containing protein [Bacteroidia bacterium]